MKAAGILSGRSQPRQKTEAVERSAWLALASVPGLGTARIATLVREFGSASAVLEAPKSAIAELSGFSERAAAMILKASIDGGQQLQNQAHDAGQRLLVPVDPEYPSQLRGIPDPPAVLYCRGDLALLSADCVAIVGSRDHSAYGSRVARKLGQIAAESDLVVVSGMARGLDAVAQSSALKSDGKTIGVLGTGADVVYPQQNWRLFKSVLENGLLISELSPGSRPHAGAFPRRNRLISGLARALVVVEAAERSGTLITVGSALEQGREVFAIPGPVDQPTSGGTNRLIRDGATPILDPNDLPLMMGLPVAQRRPRKISPNCTLSAEEAMVLNALHYDPVHVNDLALKVGLPISTILGALLGLELGGLAAQQPGSLFRKC